jgi:superfamily II DNA or RNA helicase
MDLRPYQQQAINSVLTKWKEFNRLLGVAPTGSGKTIKFAHIAKARARAGRVLILAHRDVYRSSPGQAFPGVPTFKLQRKGQ